MMDFDIALTRPEHFYVRYSDDMLILGKDKQKLLALMNEIKIRLGELHLTANESKTLCCELMEGVDFLGYHLDNSGKTIPAKAEDRLYDRLETMWLTNPMMNVEEKSAKALEIIGGWLQYYRNERTMQSIYEYIAFVYAAGGRKEMLERLQAERPALRNACRDIAEYLALFWKKHGLESLELLEYEQYFDVPASCCEHGKPGRENEDVSGEAFEKDKESDRYLPSPIASLDGFILLAAMGDPLVGNGKLADAITMIKRIRSMVFLRNNSIFAHGLGPVNHKDFIRFRTFVFDMFRNFCEIENMDFKECEQYIAWINPMLSENYARAIR